MKAIILALAIVTTTAHAEMIIMDVGNYIVQTSGSTTYVTGPNRGSMPIAVPVTVNPATGIGQVHTPQGSYLVQRSSTGSTTTVIQTSKSK
jgi:hypothetical protein